MNFTDSNRNGSDGVAPATVESLTKTIATSTAREPASTAPNGNDNSPETFATRADVKTAEGIPRSRFLLLGGGLAVAVLFFVLTAFVAKPPKRRAPAKQALRSQVAKQQPSTSKGSVTPLMDAPPTPPQDNTSGQLGPADIRRTRSLDEAPIVKPPGSKPAKSGSLGDVPSFAETQQEFEDPAPYKTTPPAETLQNQQNALKEPSLIFVRSKSPNQPTVSNRIPDPDDETPRLALPPGTRVEAQLETQISSAVLAPIVAVVEYTYAIGDRIIVPAGARMYGQLQQADRSGLVSVKFDEIELLDGARERIDAVGTGLDLGPIKGDVYGKNTGKTFLLRAASGLGSVLAEVAGNNTSAAFSEDDMLRERLAENIGTAGDSELMGLNANSRIVVSVPADTKIYVVFTKHEPTPSALRRDSSIQ